MGEYWPFVIYLIIGLAVGLYHLWKVLDYYRRRSASPYWPVAQGRVLERHVNVSRGNRGSKAIEARIDYDYTVLGQTFTSKLSLGSKWSEAAAWEALEKVPETLEVRYNPQKPAEHFSGMEGVRYSDVAFTIIPLLFVFIMVISLLFGEPAAGGGSAH